MCFMHDKPIGQLNELQLNHEYHVLQIETRQFHQPSLRLINEKFSLPPVELLLFLSFIRDEHLHQILSIMQQKIIPV